MTAPHDDGQEAPVASASQASATEPPAPQAPPAAAPAPSVSGAAPGSSATPAPAPAPRLDPHAVVPDYPPSQESLPPAPTSPALHTAPLGSSSAEPVVATAAPVSPIDAVREPALAGPAHQGPVVPRTGQPRFSVPGLEHVLVEGTEPETTGPVGYRTPARFAHQQAGSVVAPDRSFDAVLAAPAVQPETVTRHLPTADLPDVTVAGEADPVLPSDTAADARRTLGATPAAALGAVAGIATLGLAAWWFTAPATVHAVGLLLGLVAIVCSSVALRDRAATWQRPVALLGAVLGAVGTVVLLWAVATALLPIAGITLPDLTGTATVPTLAP
ncbi:hypothetical protein [Curtobacterium sp. VKM Ac-2922]|uniref:hypothetical protein n=1 Tax=Curtobacterium sp. VKM Ac-2922 TaxID=2929475 RepID=UPI001FB3B27E|nr:hypothetical protein [Curtobacterium sp. VKM Ac-2922]MCJ1715352.1 hypothetical protein [Curtobacterium sp. VKM Ac-2922]